MVRGYAKDEVRTRKRRSGISTVVSAAIMIAAVSMLGSVMVIWANSNFNAQQRQIGDYYEKNSNLLKETYIIEDVWTSKSPVNYVNVTLRNIGSIAVDVKEIKISGLKSDGTTYSSATATSFPCGASPNHCSRPANTDGLISIKTTLRLDVYYVWDNSANIKNLDISVTTERGSIERILWKVAN